MNKADLMKLLQRLSKAGVKRVPKKHKEAKALLALSLVDLNVEAIFDEQEIDAHLAHWLKKLAVQGDGVDYVTWRRALVDYGFLRRATDGVIYRIRPETIAEALSEDAQAVDPHVVFVDSELARHERQQQFRNG